MCGVKRMEFKIGDMVVRKCYGRDILFGIIRIDEWGNGEGVGVLEGDEVRLMGEGDLGDVEIVGEGEWEMRKGEEERRMKEWVDVVGED